MRSSPIFPLPGLNGARRELRLTKYAIHDARESYFFLLSSTSKLSKLTNTFHVKSHTPYSHNGPNLACPACCQKWYFRGRVLHAKGRPRDTLLADAGEKRGAPMRSFFFLSCSIRAFKAAILFLCAGGWRRTWPAEEVGLLFQYVGFP